jgi:hypothetical protein
MHPDVGLVHGNWPCACSHDDDEAVADVGSSSSVANNRIPEQGQVVCAAGHNVNICTVWQYSHGTRLPEGIAPVCAGPQTGPLHAAACCYMGPQVRTMATSRSMLPPSTAVLRCLSELPGCILLLLLLHKTTQPIRLLARESFRNAISQLQNIVYGILLVNHVHQAAQVRIR